jgi:predicted CoA-binding protein
MVCSAFCAGGNAVNNDIPTIRRILKENHTIAMVGLSADWYRPSFFAAKYLQDHGFRVIPVTPKYEEILGEKCYPRVVGIPEPIDVVDCFRRPEEIPAIAEEAIEVGAKVLWMQLGIVNEEAASRAREGGLEVVMNRCMKIEYARLFGGLSWVGVNTKVISAKRPMYLTY